MNLLLNTLEVIEELNLSRIRGKLMLPIPEGKGWTLEQTDNAEKLYKRFLTLCIKYPQARLVPSKFIDEFWHMHILDTKKYAEDCQEMFGEFMHHYPYSGVINEEDSEIKTKDDLDECFKQTSELYFIEFGESYLTKQNTEMAMAGDYEGNPNTCSRS